MLDPCNNLRKLMSKDDLEYFYDAVEKEISVFIKSPPVLGSRAVIEKQSAEAKRDSLWKPRTQEAEAKRTGNSGSAWAT